MAATELGNVTSEPRWRFDGLTNPGAITQLRITFNVPPTGPGPNPVTIYQQTGCPPGSQVNYVPYPGSQTLTSSIAGNVLVLGFTPGLENARTYKLRVNTTVTRVASQTFEVRCLKGDANSSGRVNALDRSTVVGVWTGSGYSIATDLNLNGRTNLTDLQIVVGAWTGSSNCAP